MHSSFRTALIGLLSLCLGVGAAAADKYRLAADNRIRAQQLVNKVMAENPGLVSVGMHCVPPGGNAQAIVASTLNVIGKPSDPPDVDVGTHGETIISPNLKVPKIGVMMPLHDRTGKEIGAFAIAFKFKPGEDQVKYFARATEIRDRVAQEIPSLADLFVAVP
ncbi:MAG: hypothetical protein JWM35_2355 [Verrucomicrobia bacterium]|nr:hypothetical protein [Verrucomicrobiota bacterium]